jgi:hypothetical protein
MSTKILVELGGPGRTKLAAMREVGAQQVTADLAMDELEATARVLRTVWPQPTGNDNGRGGRLSRPGAIVCSGDHLPVCDAQAKIMRSGLRAA